MARFSADIEVELSDFNAEEILQHVRGKGYVVFLTPEDAILWLQSKGYDVMPLNPSSEPGEVPPVTLKSIFDAYKTDAARFDSLLKDFFWQQLGRMA